MANIVSLALCLVLGSFVVTAGAQGHQGPMLPGCGIAYPGGYDVNTVGHVEGRLLDLQVPDDGPVRLVVVDGGGEQWVVLTSPRWYWRMTGLRLAPGDIVNVMGSKTLGADGTLYLVARDISMQASGAAATLRDRHGAPLWKESSRGGRAPGGVGSGAGGGMGRGLNGGRGRR